MAERYVVVWGNGSTGTPAGQLDGDFASREEAERAAGEALARWDNPACGAWVKQAADGPDGAGRWGMSVKDKAGRVLWLCACFGKSSE